VVTTFLKAIAKRSLMVGSVNMHYGWLS